MPFVQDDDVIQKLSAKATDHAFNRGILPGGGWCCDNFINTERLELSLNPVTIDAIAVSQQILRGCVERKRFYDLLGRPLRGRMFRYVEVDNAPSLMRQYDEHKKHFEGHRWHDKEVDSSDIFRMLYEECPPCGRGWST